MSYLDTINQNVDPIEEPSGKTGSAFYQNREVEYGSSIEFWVRFRDENEDLYDPAEVEFDIYKNPLNPMTKRFALSASEITNDSTGVYKIEISIPEYLVPGMYTARWIIDDDGDDLYVYEQFYVIDPPVAARDQLDPPTIRGKIQEAVDYFDLGKGLTDAICLIGHVDGLTVNDPYFVNDLQKAIDLMQADTDSPVVRAMLEAYSAGCRDIWVVAAAPMREYVDSLEDRAEEKVEWGNRNFYERYAQRLLETYRILKTYDNFDLIVPLEAPFYDSLDVDFFTPLADLCLSLFYNTGVPPVGIIGSRFDALSQDDIDLMLEDERIPNLHTDESLIQAGKMVLVALGEGIIQNKFLNLTYKSSLNVSIAAYMASSNLLRGVMYSKLPNVLNLSGLDLRKSQVEELANKRINPAIRTAKGKRGRAFEIVMATDHTMAPEGSDYWSVIQMRIVSRIIRDLRSIGAQYIGSIDLPMLTNAVKEYFYSLRDQDYLRDYSFTVKKDENTLGNVIIEVILYPRLGVNDITFSVNVGPESPVSMVSPYSDFSPISLDDMSIELPDEIVVVE